MSSGPSFVRRETGLGWRPARWEGWLVTIVAIGLIVAVQAIFRLHKSPMGYIGGLVIIGLYLLVVVATARGRETTGRADTGGPAAESRPLSEVGDGDTGVSLIPHAVAATSGSQATVERREAPIDGESVPPQSLQPAALIVDGLTKRFGNRVAFQDVSFSVGTGEVFGFLGPNGAGKTTTVRTLGTLIAPTAGSAVVAGLPLTPDNGEAIRQHISIMPEAPGLYLRLSVYENLAFFAALFGVQDPHARINQALQAVNLASRAEDLCGSLSKGLRQRVALARALLNDPAILFLDEPTSGLDPVATHEVHELIGDLRRRGVTVFLTTHRLEEAERLCDRVAILNTTLRMLGKPAELRSRLFKKSVVVTTAAPLTEPDRLFAQLPGLEGWQRDEAGRYVLTVADPRIATPAVARALVAAGVDLLSLGEGEHSLEDVYLELIADDVEAQPA